MEVMLIVGLFASSALSLNFIVNQKYKYSKRVTQLFITLLERSSGQNFPEYFFRKIWQPLQPEHTGYWSLDSKIAQKLRPRGLFS